MRDKILARTQLSEAIATQLGLPRQASRALQDMLLDEIADELVVGHDVRIQSFDSFSIRKRWGGRPPAASNVPD